MKTLLTILSFCLSLTVFADKYTEQMAKNIDMVYKAGTIEDLQQAVNAFERIGQAEKTKWEPYYYATFGYIMMSTREKDVAKMDVFLDLATADLEKAIAIQPNESEIVALQGFIFMMRTSVDPATRGQKYSMLAMQSFSKAIGMNENNPRAHALLAQLQLGTARFFQQEPVEACQSAAKAKLLFETPSDNANPLAPKWGKSMNEGLLANCPK